MVAHMEKLKTWFLACISWLVLGLTKKVPLWLSIVVSLAAVLLILTVSCERDKSLTRAVVGSMEYEGHFYLVFSRVNDGSISVVHDPDCGCHFIEVLPNE